MSSKPDAPSSPVSPSGDNKRHLKPSGLQQAGKPSTTPNKCLVRVWAGQPSGVIASPGRPTRQTCA
eukprot:12241103-Alexandrium_andersonii.AAC.1